MNRRKKHKPNYKSFRKKIPMSEKMNNTKFIYNGLLFIIVSIIFFVIYKYYSRHTIKTPSFIYLIMIAIGVFFSIKENLDVIKSTYINKVIIIREYLGLFLLIIIYSIKNFILFGSIIYAIFHFTNQIYSNSNRSEIFNLEIVDINRHSSAKVSSSIKIIFKGKELTYFTEDKALLELEENKETMSQSRLRLNLKEGIFGCYFIENERIIR